jgi:uncharacterized damage-inducible protein DinB
MDQGRADLLQRLAGGPDRIAEVARAADLAGRADERSAPWSARQNVAHLVLVERLVFQPRLDQLAGPDVPSWSWTEPGTSDAPEVATLEAALASFAAVRASTVARVTALDEAGWRRYGRHATYGRLDVAGLLGVIVDHDDHHRADIGGLADRGGGAR